MNADNKSMTVNGRSIHLMQGDITKAATDAIVNAANERLLHGGGVAGAIARHGGSSIQDESNAWIREHGLVRTGGAAVTGGGFLKARHVIHSVGPVYGSGDEDAKLAAAVGSALAIAETLQLESITFPAISTGIFGFPLDRCAQIMLQVFIDFFAKERCLKTVVICLWDQSALEVFARELECRKTEKALHQ